MRERPGFLRFGRSSEPYRPVGERRRDWHMVLDAWPPARSRQQASRCMDCGVPTCTSGCPLGNVIPDWNLLLSRDRWPQALERLQSTNNFPEFTGASCPAPCEPACVLAVNDQPVTIRQIEYQIALRGWEEGWVRPRPPERRTEYRVAVVGSGPAGLAAAQQLNRAGHRVCVYEKSDRFGGLLTYGIPDFKLAKPLVARRVDQLRSEGVRFRKRVWVGVDLSAEALLRNHDAVLLCVGAERARDLDLPGRELRGIHLAKDFLVQQNRRLQGDCIARKDVIVATDEDVVVIGGGDTASDCVGTAHRQGARSVTTLQLWGRPPEDTNPLTPWPQWPLVFRTSSSYQEGGDRDFAVRTTRFSGADGRVDALHAVRLEITDIDAAGRGAIAEIPNSEFALPASLVLIAIGYANPEPEGLLSEISLCFDPRGNVATGPGGYQTDEAGVFAAGDCRRGQSLIVWAISEGREAAREVDMYLQGSSSLPGKDTTEWPH